ncbi:hypothetical protein M569_10441, partial [Genlisea aurea]
IFSASTVDVHDPQIFPHSSHKMSLTFASDSGVDDIIASTQRKWGHGVCKNRDINILPKKPTQPLHTQEATVRVPPSRTIRLCTNSRSRATSCSKTATRSDKGDWLRCCGSVCARGTSMRHSPDVCTTLCIFLRLARSKGAGSISGILDKSSRDKTLNSIAKAVTKLPNFK